MTTRLGLLSVHAELTAALRASEGWEQSYRDSPATFKRLLREEAAMQAALVSYFAGLDQRADGLVNWSEVQLRPIQAAAVPPLNDDLFTGERALLYQAIYDHVLEITVIGGQAGEVLYQRPIGINSLTEFILDAAEHQTAGLVSNVTETTRKNIQRSIKQSIAQGEDYLQSLDRIKKSVANPVRAEMIAQTESVNAYQSGMANFAAESGAKSKTWDALSGACQLCSPLHGKTVKIEGSFVLPTGTTVLRPAAHPRCRCGLIYNY